EHDFLHQLRQAQAQHLEDSFRNGGFGALSGEGRSVFASSVFGIRLLREWRPTCELANTEPANTELRTPNNRLKIMAQAQAECPSRVEAAKWLIVSVKGLVKAFQPVVQDI